MIQINLLPWREQARQVKKQNFVWALAATIFISLIVIGIIHFYLSNIDSIQQEENSYLQTVLSQEQIKLTDLQKRKQNAFIIEFQLRFLIGLKKASFKVVKILTELEKIIPPTVSLNSLSKSGKTILLTGEAQTDLDITHFMENIKNAKDFKHPILSEIATGNETYERKTFKLQAVQE